MGKGDMAHQGHCWTLKQMSCLPMQFICSTLENFECSMRIKIDMGDLQSCAKSMHTWSTYFKSMQHNLR